MKPGSPRPKYWMLEDVILLVSVVNTGYGEQLNEFFLSSAIAQQNVVSGVVFESKGVTLIPNQIVCPLFDKVTIRCKIHC